MDWVMWTLFNFSVVGFVVVGVASEFVDPPPKFPHLWHLLISVFSAAHFIAFAAYFNLVHFDVYRSAKSIEAAAASGKKRQ